MTHRVVWSEQADAELDVIYDWIADRADPEVALRFVLRIKATGEKLAEFPNRGRSRDEIRLGLRSVSLARTVTILYDVTADEVRIARVIHTHRDLDQAFADE